MSVEINETNFPDVAFRQYISDKFDTDQDGTLSDEEVAAIQSIYLSSEESAVQSIQGVELFSNLQSLYTYMCTNLGDLVIDGLNALEICQIKYSQSVTSIQIQNCPMLETIRVQDNGSLITLSVINCPNLTYLACNPSISTYDKYDVKLSSLTLNGVPKLETLTLDQNALTILDVSQCVGLKTLQCFDNQLTSINFGQIENLESVGIHTNNLTRLNIPYSPKLSSLICDSNNISTLYLLFCPLLIDAVKNGTRSGLTVRNHPDGYVKSAANGSPSETIYFDGSTTLVVDSQIEIVQQPLDVTIPSANTMASFDIVAQTTVQNLAYRLQWESKAANANTWETLTGETRSYLEIPAGTVSSNTDYRCKVSTDHEAVYSNVAHLFIQGATGIEIITHPEAQSAAAGETIVFSVEAQGTDLTYQWQVSHDGSTWSDLAGATESTCSRVASETTDGDQYRCKITDGNGNSVTSQAATLTVTSSDPGTGDDPSAVLAITRQPSSQTVAAGSSVTFFIEAQGNDLTYRWEYCLPNTQNWIYADGDYSSITIPNVDSDRNRVQYRCIVTDGSGNSLTSNAATLVVTSSEPGTDPNPGEDDGIFKIIRQPKNTTAISGAEATFSVVAQGTDLSYQWQFSSDSGSSWLDVQSDGRSNAYTFTVGDAQNGYLFRCVVAQGTETLTTDSVRLTVRELPSSPERKTYLPSEMADAIRQLGLAGIDLDDIPFGNMPDGLAITTLGSRGATSPEWYEEIAEAINVLKTGIDIEDYQIFKVKTITENGEYAAVEDDCYGFSLVDVDVFGGDSIVDRTVSEPYSNDKITTVGAYAFCSCNSLPAVDVPNCANIWGWAFSGCTSLSFVSAPNCSMVGSNAFEYCANLLSISLPNCKALSDYAFSNCRSLALVSFPLCEIIGDGAFQGCTSLTSAEFPMCGTIGNDAFNACTRLVLADFPVCGNVGVRAFQNCAWLTSVSLPNCSVVGVEAFKYCSGLLSIEFPLCTSIGSSAFLSCTSLAEVSFPECTNIGAWAFVKCSALTYASFPLCTLIGQSAFNQCSSLSYADFPVCSSIGTYVFSSCTNLVSANFPLCTIVPGCAFYKCERLSYVSIPNCSWIGSSAFYSCHDLLAISLPNCSVIGSNAFYSCSNLSALYLYGSSMCKLAASNALYSTAIASGRGWIYVPESLYNSYIYATNWSYYAVRFSHTVNVRATMSGTTLSLSGTGVAMSNNVLSLSAATVSMSNNQLVFP